MVRLTVSGLKGGLASRAKAFGMPLPPGTETACGESDTAATKGNELQMFRAMLVNVYSCGRGSDDVVPASAGHRRMVVDCPWLPHKGGCQADAPLARAQLPATSCEPRPSRRAPPEQSRGRGDLNPSYNRAITVGRICRRFAQDGLETALLDKPRPGREPKITGDVQARLVTLCCSDPPQGRGRWTLRLLAARMVELGYLESISEVAIGKRLKKRDQALAGKILVHSCRLGQVRGQEGGRARGLCSSLRPQAPGRLCG